MESKVKDIELIERFLEGQLSEEELESFEKRRKEDSDFNQSVDEMSLMVGAIKESARESLMDELRELEAALPEVALEEDVEKRGSRLRIVKGGRSTRKIVLWAVQVAAAAAVLTGFYFGIGEPVIRSSREPKPQRGSTLGSQIVRPGTGVRGEIEQIAEEDLAFFYYQQTEYGKVIRELKNSSTMTDEDWLILGNSYYKKKRFKKAAECLQPENFPEGSKHADAARFWLAKCWIALDEKEKAKILLENIAQSNGDYSRASQQLLQSKRLSNNN